MRASKHYVSCARQCPAPTTVPFVHESWLAISIFQSASTSPSLSTGLGSWIRDVFAMRKQQSFWRSSLFRYYNQTPRFPSVSSKLFVLPSTCVWVHPPIIVHAHVQLQPLYRSFIVGDHRHGDLLRSLKPHCHYSPNLHRTWIAARLRRGNINRFDEAPHARGPPPIYTSPCLAPTIPFI
ncbi:hypothetical protein FA13DRAFT_975064 [Coprinellus micaceus]|uniref:Uncharacterized protein n=1 Tax=Coprinellus micaceus TaxID=71717 RepID=A0A4Y7T0M1_COPMI|nr:hypothetical protein FA13DRAFT_975064 [Coprinellus micaceus]